MVILQIKKKVFVFLFIGGSRGGSLTQPKTGHAVSGEVGHWVVLFSLSDESLMLDFFEVCQGLPKQTSVGRIPNGKTHSTSAVTFKLWRGATSPCTKTQP